jgi:uncharacterized protein (TIGR02996 family)
MTTLTADAEGLLRAILDDPEDDTPRLVYADWLEEFGDAARAEFIRVQISIAKVGPMSPGRGSSTFAYWLEREKTLWNLPGVGGAGKFAIPSEVTESIDLAEYIDQEGRTKGPSFKGVVWRRGFPDSIHCPLAAFLEHAAALFAAHPITAVTLTCRHHNTATAKPGWLVAHPNWCNPDGSLKEGAGGHWLPGCLVPPGAVNRGTALGGGFCYFDTPQEADAALSGWCVACGRDKAGLPPLGAA